MIPLLGKEDLKMFNKYLDAATIYFEYGSGGSTYLASQKKNIQLIYSVESDVEWHNTVKNNNNNNKITYLPIDMQTIPNNWGYPGKNATDQQKINYSNQIINNCKNGLNNPDTIFIDGRFRVACCLKCFNIINYDAVILFDDFLNRSWYHDVLNYYEIIDRTTDNRMVVLKKKKYISSIPLDIISKYELDPR